jgi:hypothetical protein
MWLSTYWHEDESVPPAHVEYLRGESHLYIDGEHQELTHDWERHGHQIEILEPGQLLSLEFTVRVSPTTPIGTSIGFPVRFFAEGHNWWGCSATATVI